MAKEGNNNSGPQKEKALEAWASYSRVAAEMAEEALKEGRLADAQACTNIGFAAAQAYGIMAGTYQVGDGGNAKLP